jgi:hypothetical protein
MYTDGTTTVQQTSSTTAEQTSLTTLHQTSPLTTTSQQTSTTTDHQTSLTTLQQTSTTTTTINISNYNFFLIIFAYLHNSVLFVVEIESSTNALSTFLPDITTTRLLQEKGW